MPSPYFRNVTRKKTKAKNKAKTKTKTQLTIKRENKAWKAKTKKKKAEAAFTKLKFSKAQAERIAMAVRKTITDCCDGSEYATLFYKAMGMDLSHLAVHIKPGSVVKHKDTGHTFCVTTINTKTKIITLWRSSYGPLVHTALKVLTTEDGLPLKL